MLDYKILYLPDGFSGKTYRNVTKDYGVVKKIVEVPYDKEKKSPPSIDIVINTKSFTQNDKSMFLVLSRVNINDSQSFPIS